jgi:drug/metabolite transporter (DMT)-like permease
MTEPLSANLSGMTSKHLVNVVTLVTLAALWGASFLFIRIAVPVFGAMSLMGARVIVAGLLLWIGLRVTGRRPLALRANARHLLVLGAVNAAVPFTLVAASELHLNASLAAALIATSPLFSAVLSARSAEERIDGRRVIGLLLGVIGVGVLVGWSPMVLTRAAMLSIPATLLAAACYAYAGEYTKRHLASVPSPTLAFGQQLGAAAWLTGPALFNLPAFPVPSTALWALLGLAALCTSAAYILYFHLIARIGPVRTNSVTYLIPVFGLLWGALFLGEPMAPGILLGLGIILSSVLLVNAVPSSVGRRRVERKDGGEDQQVLGWAETNRA